MDSHGRIIETQVDEWASGSTQFRGQSWVGQTRFYIKLGPGSVQRALTQDEIVGELGDSDLMQGLTLPVNPRRSGHVISEDLSDFWEVKGRF